MTVEEYTKKFSEVFLRISKLDIQIPDIFGGDSTAQIYAHIHICAALTELVLEQQRSKGV